MERQVYCEVKSKVGQGLRRDLIFCHNGASILLCQEIIELTFVGRERFEYMANLMPTSAFKAGFDPDWAEDICRAVYFAKVFEEKSRKHWKKKVRILNYGE